MVSSIIISMIEVAALAVCAFLLLEARSIVRRICFQPGYQMTIRDMVVLVVFGLIVITAVAVLIILR